MNDKRPYRLPWQDLDRGLIASGPEASGAEVPILATDRREFLKLLGLSGVIGGLAACERLPVRHALPYLHQPEAITPGVSVKYASTCTACNAGCGLMVTVRDGRPIKLEGNREHPLSRGGLCARGQADLRALYDAGRLAKPALDGKEATWPQVDERIRERLAAVSASGKSVVVLAPTLVSPALREAVGRFLDPVRGTLVEHDGGVDRGSAVLEAYETIDGKAAFPALRIDRADILVGLGVDLLATGEEPVAHTAQYSARRREGRDGFRHVQIEGSLSLTGASADERIQARSAERHLVALWLLRLVAEARTGEVAQAARGAVGSLPPLSNRAERVRELAAEIHRHGRRALVVSGSRDAGEQVAVALLNRILGAEGHTLDLAKPSLVRRGRDGHLLALVDRLARGQVGALFVVDRNPVEELPNGEELAKSIGALPLSVAITTRPTATARACSVIAAAHHGLERWGDAEPRVDVSTPVQPTIRPLHSTRDPIESFTRWSGDGGSTAPSFVKDVWRRRWAPDSEDEVAAMWTRSLSSGLVASTAALAVTAVGEEGAASGAVPTTAPVGATAVELAPPRMPAAGELEVELIAESALGDGRSSFNPWLRELPEPITRTSWVATARVAPALAAKNGIHDGDVVSLRVGDKEVRLPARVQPGQHRDVIAVPIGYGLADGDGGERLRNGLRLASVNRGALATAGLGASLSLAGGRVDLPLMQVHADTEGRPIVHQVASSVDGPDAGHHGKPASLWPKREYRPHWQMVIDLDACTGCGACVVACQAENNLPVVGPDQMRRHRDMYWIRIDRYYVGDSDDPEVLFEPMLCAQCDNAPCETVCPVAATVHGTDGLNQQAYNRCVGTRYCANNCPYKVRRFNWLDYTPKDPVERLVLNPDVVVRERGIMEKCTFCVQRIQRARIDSKADGVQRVAETACQQSCPARAISFGDGSVEGSEINAQRHHNRAFQVLAELGVEPSLTYLARVRRNHGGKS